MAADLKAIVKSRALLCVESTYIYSAKSGAAWASLFDTNPKSLPGRLSGLKPEAAMNRLRAFIYGAKAPVAENALDLGNCKSFAILNVPSLPPNFQPRHDLFLALKKAVLLRADEAVAVTGVRDRVGVQGMGGIGKTVIVSALAHDADIAKAYPQGVIWITVGTDANLSSLLEQLCRALGDNAYTARTIQEGKTRLGKLLIDKECLLILDDLWTVAHYETFDVNPVNSKFVFTTRNHELVDVSGAVRVDTELMSTLESLQLVASWAGQTVPTLPPEADEVVRECGRLPLALALAMVGAMVSNEIISWKTVLRRLQRADLDKIQKKFPNYPYPSILKAIEASVRILIPARRKRYLSLAVFRDDAEIPLQTLLLYFRSQGVEDGECEESVNDFLNRSLLQSSGHRFVLHDLQRDYVRVKCANQRGLHKILADAYLPKGTENGHTLAPDGYNYENLIFHLARAEQAKAAGELLSDFKWLRSKTKVTGINRVLDDFGLVQSPPYLQLLGRALRQSAHRIGPETSSMSSQVTGRLAGNKNPNIRRFLNSLTLCSTDPWLRPLTPSLGHVYGPLQLTYMHGQAITAIAVTKDGNTVLTAGNSRVSAWNRQTGEILRHERVHADCMVLSPNGRYIAVASGAYMEIRLADLHSVVHILRGSKKTITALAFSADSSRLISGTIDSSLLIWDVATGKKTGKLGGRIGLVTAVSTSSSGNLIAAASCEGIVRVWDLREPTSSIARIKFDKPVSSLLFTHGGDTLLVALDDGHVLSCNAGQWSPGPAVHVHDGAVYSMCEDPSSRRVLMGSADQTVSMWNETLTQKHIGLKAHTGIVKSVHVGEGGEWCLSGANDGFAKLWNLDERKSSHQDQKNSTSEVVLLRSLLGDSWFLSGHADGSLRVYCHDGTLRCINNTAHRNRLVGAGHMSDSRALISVDEAGVINKG